MFLHSSISLQKPKWSQPTNQAKTSDLWSTPRIHVRRSCHVSLVSCNLDLFLHLSVSPWWSALFLLRPGLSWCRWDRNVTDIELCSPHPLGRGHTMCPCYLDANLNTWVRSCPTGLCTVEALVFPLSLMRFVELVWDHVYIENPAPWF